ncbi:sortase [bacterium]|nr:sortase [bacterium]
MKKILLVFLLLLLMGCQKEKIEDDVSLEKNNYYGFLIIPSLNMTYGFYDTQSKLNDVNKNVALIDSNIENTYILAAHSGMGNLAYFNDLKYLRKKDKIYLKFENKTLEYEVVNIRSNIKNGKIRIKNKENQLILTTCDQIKKGNQLIIEANLQMGDN